MSKGLRLRMAIIAVPALLAACVPGAAPNGGDRPSSALAQTTLVLAPRGEPSSLTPIPLFSAAGPSTGRSRLFNAALNYVDGAGESHPYLAEALPELNTNSWRVFPDGRMETTFRLRPNLSWHDGTPLSASDFVLGWRVVSDPELGLSGLTPHNLMEEVSAPDERTVQIRWRQPFPDAALLDGWSRGLVFMPLPRHLMESVWGQGPDAVRNSAFWTTGYVGAGPYRLERWESGAFLEGRAFDGHVTGRPKIDRLKVLFVLDANAILAYLLAGEAHVAIDNSVGFEQGLVLKEQWAQGGGTVRLLPSALHWVGMQHRPDYANPRAILDVRVRRALAYAIDKPALNEALFQGLGTTADSIALPGRPYFPTIDQAVTKYPYDVRRTEQLMVEAGFPKDREGIYAQSGAGRLSFEFLVTPNPENEKGRVALAAGWREAGFQVEEGLMPRGQGQNEATSTFRSLFGTAGDADMGGVSRFASATISRAETRWVGENTTGWSNPEYDRAAAGVATALDPTERVRYFAQAAKVMSEELGTIFIYYSPYVLAYPSGLYGISVTNARAETTWNIQDWEFK